MFITLCIVRIACHLISKWYFRLSLLHLDTFMQFCPQEQNMSNRSRPVNIDERRIGLGVSLAMHKSKYFTGTAVSWWRVWFSFFLLFEELKIPEGSLLASQLDCLPCKQEMWGSQAVSYRKLRDIIQFTLIANHVCGWLQPLYESWLECSDVSDRTMPVDGLVEFYFPLSNVGIEPVIIVDVYYL